MKVEAFIIHLKRAEARLPQVRRLQEILPVPASVIEAVDGQQLSDEDIAAVYQPKMHRPRYPFALRKGEIACFLSHRKAWQRIVDSGLDAGLVVEDDAALDPALFPQALSLALAHARSSDLVRFPHRQNKEKGHVIAWSGDVSIVKPQLPGLGTVMQLVGREAAQALLAATAQFDRPIDVLQQMLWVHDVRILAVDPAGLREASGDLGGTAIQHGTKGFFEKLFREVRRPIYRLSIRARSYFSS